jgi:hypothetical protein
MRCFGGLRVELYVQNGTLQPQLVTNSSQGLKDTRNIQNDISKQKIK